MRKYWVPYENDKLSMKIEEQPNERKTICFNLKDESTRHEELSRADHFLILE